DIPSLQELRVHMQQHIVCELQKTATHLVFGKGNEQASVVIIGEAPGKQEDEQGIPFVGKAGKALDGYMQQAHLSDVYITNMVKYRPPNNRNPTLQEIRVHAPYLLAQLRIMQPKLLITLGNIATKFILAQADTSKIKNMPGISHVHGKIHTVYLNGYEVQVFPLYHPAALMYRGSLKEQMNQDIQKLREFLQED
ncbi:MAG: uracil-DNA glycosylase, partial [Candidatus Woesearchaeota archaeon]